LLVKIDYFKEDIEKYVNALQSGDILCVSGALYPIEDKKDKLSPVEWNSLKPYLIQITKEVLEEEKSFLGEELYNTLMKETMSIINNH